MGPGFALVGLGVDPRRHLGDAGRHALNLLGARYATLYAYGERPQAADVRSRDADPDLPEVEDLQGTMVEWFKRAGLRKHGIAILRPDRFAFAVVHPRDLESAVAELARQLALRQSADLPRERARVA